MSILPYSSDQCRTEQVPREWPVHSRPSRSISLLALNPSIRWSCWLRTIAVSAWGVHGLRDKRTDKDRWGCCKALDPSQPTTHSLLRSARMDGCDGFIQGPLGPAEGDLRRGSVRHCLACGDRVSCSYSQGDPSSRCAVQRADRHTPLSDCQQALLLPALIPAMSPFLDSYYGLGEKEERTREGR